MYMYIYIFIPTIMVGETLETSEHIKYFKASKKHTPSADDDIFFLFEASGTFRPGDSESSDPGPADS